MFDYSRDIHGHCSSMIFFNFTGDFDQDNDHLIIDEDVLEERQALAPLDQLVQPGQILKKMDKYNKKLGQI